MTTRWRGLRLRFIVASGLLVVTTIVASVWTLVSLSRLSGIVSEIVRDSDVITEVTARLSNGLEREDDALLLVLARKGDAGAVLARERDAANRSLGELARLSEDTDPALVGALQQEVAAYRAAADRVAATAAEADALARYHREANPPLRRAVATVTAIREQRFEAGRTAVTQARDAAERARRAVFIITLVALGIAVIVAAHLTARVVGPLRVLTRRADAFRQGEFGGEFGEPLPIVSRDELGDLAAAFNHMAEDLAEFHRTNVREVVRAKATLEATLAALPDAVALFDADGRVLSMNRAAADVFTLAGVGVPASIDDITLEGVELSALRRTMRGETVPPQGTDLTRALTITAEQRVRRLLPRVVGVPGLGPGPGPGLGPERGGAILLLYDVTELARVDEMRSELVAVASHELQTPLTTLRMTLLMLRERMDAMSERERELVTTALGGVEQLVEIVHEFLDLTRIEAGELRLNLEPLPFGEVVTDAIDRLASRADAQGVRLTATGTRDAGLIVGDARRLRSVLDNLIANALNHAPVGTIVHLDLATRAATATSPGGVTLSVTDHGPGVQSALRTRIFEKFFRLDQQAPLGRPATRGAGIGLYMCRQIVERHGGRITCEAAPDHSGARFIVELPHPPANGSAT